MVDEYADANNALWKDAADTTTMKTKAETKETLLVSNITQQNKGTGR